ncbi:hypothetical protein MBCUR_05920 [Methanobrevibacter curvatus]|uniref:Uncharacterized protein n=1 Tax=Methanobrevibacter curvatus TaxID=49547 RepID=A0A166CCJ8_9EURY|nr:hypothetical protein MBCUR_05920 [Methanobrevibacter curvatus]
MLLAIAPPLFVFFPFLNVRFLKVTFRLLPVMLKNIPLLSASRTTELESPLPWTIKFLLLPLTSIFLLLFPVYIPGSNVIVSDTSPLLCAFVTA